MLNFEYDADLEREVIAKEAFDQGLEQAALNMLKDNQDLSYITKITGITLSRLHALQKEIES